jgi:UDP-N-acetylglucosamine 4-epimerase
MLHPVFEKHEVMNVACGDQISLNEMLEMLRVISHREIISVCGPERTGDVRHSKASISKIQSSLNYNPTIKFNNGLKIVYNWYMNTSINK